MSPTAQGRPAVTADAPSDHASVPANAGQVSGIRRMWGELGRDEESLVVRLNNDFAQQAPEALTFEQAGDLITQLIKETKKERTPV